VPILARHDGCAGTESCTIYGGKEQAGRGSTVLDLRQTPLHQVRRAAIYTGRPLPWPILSVRQALDRHYKSSGPNSLKAPRYAVNRALADKGLTRYSWCCGGMARLLVGLTPRGGVGVSVGLPAITKAGASSTKQADDAYPFWLLFDEPSTCIAQLDLQLRVVGGNACFIAVFGLDVGALRGCEIINLVHSSVREKLSSQLQSLVSGDRGRFTDRLATAPGCGTANLGITGISVTNDTGRVESLIILVQPEKIDSVPAHPVEVGKPLTKVDAGVLEGVASGMSTAGNRSELISKAYAAGLFSIGMWPPRVISDFVE
jgi:hypothetical protein